MMEKVLLSYQIYLKLDEIIFIFNIYATIINRIHNYTRKKPIFVSVDEFKGTQNRKPYQYINS